jgi:hypothetical protein
MAFSALELLARLSIEAHANVGNTFHSRKVYVFNHSSE